MALQEVYKPRDVAEVLNLLNQYKGRAKIIAGGTDLIISLKEKTIKPEVLVDISTLTELKKINYKEDYIEIGGATTFTDMINAPILKQNLPALVKAAKSVGSPQIRNAGTIGGNICNASPAADMLPLLLVLEATARIKDVDGEKEMPLQQLLLDKRKVNLKENQLLYSIKIKPIVAGEGLVFEKLGFRKALAISKITIGVFAKVENNKWKAIRIASAALYNKALREKNVEEYFIGKTINENILQEGSEIFKREIATRLMDRNAGEFKAEVVKTMLIRVIKEATFHS